MLPIIEPIIGSQFPGKVIPLIDGARQTIKIVVFDWRWYPNDPANPVQLFNQAIIRAQRRGVGVGVITNIADVLIILNREGCKARRPETPKLIHSKMMIIDGEILVIGSHNYTQSAFTMNHEVSLIYRPDEPNALVEFEHYFFILWSC